MIKVTSSLQRNDGDKSVLYNTVGPNVCMGDHKVKVELVCTVQCLGKHIWLCGLTQLCSCCFLAASFLVLLTENK